MRTDELHLEWINKELTGEPGIDDVTREYHDVVRQIELLEGEFDPPIDCVLPPEYMPEPYRSNLIRRLIDGDPVLLLLFDPRRILNNIFRTISGIQAPMGKDQRVQNSAIR